MARAPRTVVELLGDLVALPSVNPTGDPGTPHVGELAVARYLEAWARRAGAAVRLSPVLPGRPNVVAVWKPRRPVKTRLWFAPHTDTVSVAGMTVPPFTPTLRRGRLYGRGASDTKGPMAAMLWAIAEWWRAGGRDGTAEVTFLGLVGEEAGNDGARAVAAKKLSARQKPDLIIVGEPTDLKVVTSHKGALWLELRTRGRACHASAPERGINAIGEMARAIAAVEAAAPRLARRPHPLLGPATLNVGTIRGGSKVNIVPDLCVVEVDVRTTPRFTARQAVMEIRRAVAAAAPRCRVTVQRGAPGLDTDARQPLIRQLAGIARGTTGVPWFCDAAIFAEAGWPAVALGPGSIRQAHTPDEYIAVRDLADGVAVYRRFLESVGGT
jgi:succinyl-diaminopimelate desuccinylase